MATAATLDSLNINDGTSYQFTGSWDWGDEAISALVFGGDYDSTQIDNVAAAARLTREVVGQLRLGPSASPGALLDLEQAVNSKLNKASRANPIVLDLLPHGATLHSFFDVVGGFIKSVYDKRQEAVRIKYLELHLECLPFVRGSAQALGTVQANALTPYSVDVTPTAGQEGDVPANVTIAVTANTTGSLHLSAVMGAAWNEATGASLPGWYDSSSMTLTGIGSTVADASARGGSVIRGTTSAINTIEAVAFVALPRPSDGWPVGLPARVFAVCKDRQTTAGNRGKALIRASMRSGAAPGGIWAHGDWTPIPPGALNGATPLFCMADLGVFPMPPAAISGTSAANNLFIYQQSSVAAATVDIDYVIVVPDSTMLYAEDPSISYTPAVTINLTNDNVFETAQTAQALAYVTGSQVRFKGPGRIFVAAHSQVAGTIGSADVSPLNAATAVTYTPRYIGLA